MRAISAFRAAAIPLLLCAVLLWQYGRFLGDSFTEDDFELLDKTRSASFGSLWSPERLNYGWYRPWSRELHFWAIQKGFGANEVPFHAANLLLACGVVIAYYAFVRRLAGPGPAAVSAAGFVALAALGVPVIWASGAQELWMMLLGLLVLHAWARGHAWWAALVLVVALLSKETAAAVALIAVAYALTVERRSLAGALRRSLPLVLVTATWAAFHPLIGGRLLSHGRAEQRWGAPVPPFTVVAKTLLALFNTDVPPRPMNGWLVSLAAGVAPAVVLAALVVAATRFARPAESNTPIAREGAASAGEGAAPAGAQPSARRTLAFATAWAALGWLPLLAPRLSWQPYYTLFGACGAWLAIGLVAARRAWVAALLVAMVALLRPARAATPAFDWGSEWYHHRSAMFVGMMRSRLLALHPHMPRHARLYFTEVPHAVGFLSGDAPALRVIYGDATVRAGYLSAYGRRGTGERLGPDYFFRFDTTRVDWVEVVEGGADPIAARTANARWEVDHRVLAAAFIKANEWARAAAEYTKLADHAPTNVDYAFNVAACAENLGDKATAARWYERAARSPDADDEVKRLAAEFRRYAADARP